MDCEDLVRLARIARLDREDLFARRPRYRVLGERLICVALCQGAALHYIDGRNGVKDFDVWTFFAARPRLPVAASQGARLRRSQIGPVAGQAGLRGPPRRPARTLAEDDDPTLVLREYLSEGRTTTAPRLSEKAVVLLEPTDRLGAVVWPLGCLKPDA